MRPLVPQTAKQSTNKRVPSPSCKAASSRGLSTRWHQTAAATIGTTRLDPRMRQATRSGAAGMRGRRDCCRAVVPQQEEIPPSRSGQHTSSIAQVAERPPLGKGALVQRHAHGVVLIDRAIKDALHVAVGAQRLADAPLPPKLGVQLDRLEPADVFWREEHPAHHGLLLVAAEGVPRQHHLLEDDAVGVDGEQRASRHRQLAEALVLDGELRAGGEEGEQRRRRVERGRVDRRDGRAAGLQEALEAVLVRAARVFRIDRLTQEATEAAVKHERLLPAEGQVLRLCCGGERDGEVHHGQAVLMLVD
mmetsp:Transcript_17899/g.38124  ORF Transcript_17899/g.38124 Transcript_17899/m.38124 type:complete len:305 (-) Transcript_17899:1142-2056(-)